MRGKRSKQYRKLMLQYGLSFGFREPYQVLGNVYSARALQIREQLLRWHRPVDADIIKDADRFKMDLTSGLERTLHGKVKPMITQCCMRHLYSSASEPGMSQVIEKAKLFERRRCDHRPEEYPEPLGAVECISSVVDSKRSKTNKHRYVIASQDLNVRKAMRGVMGTPLVYINRSVMIMEPMAAVTVQNRQKEEKIKFRAGLKSGRASGSQGMKRKREDGENGMQQGSGNTQGSSIPGKSSGSGPKGPNPLAMKKPKKRVDSGGITAPKIAPESVTIDAASETSIKHKRRRKHKPAARKEDLVMNEEADIGSTSV